ncbi:Wzy polymerase domain-containing protein [Uliginosibacterium paludis]|uniref:Wzy polymerase domain-containing protein n=1 Tax=Uliginosibacterium paludis TaxID=1615952 RepID=A0ABV2CJX9_9RHOO
MLTIRFESLILAFGLALAAMLPWHFAPQTVFFAEYAVAVSLLAVCWRFDPAGRPISRGLLGALAFAVLAAAIWPGRTGGLGYAVYLAVLLLAYLCGAQARDRALPEMVACGLLLGALLQSLAGVIQLMGWNPGGLVMQKLYLQAFGNIGQANHYGDLVFLGLASLCFLHGRNHFSLPLTLALGAWLALAAAASASRSVWLYTVVFLALGLWASWRGDAAARQTGRALLVVAILSVMAQTLVGYGHILDVFGVTSSLDRAGDAGSNGQRLYNWHAAWLAIQQHPWLGQGPGTFYKASIDAMFATAPAGFPKFAEHAHNLPLNLAAEFGLPMAVFLCLALAVWGLRHLLRPASAHSVWALAAVGVVLSHSMVEYPLWYLYFIVPVGLCMGVADADASGLRALRVPQWCAAACFVLAVAGLGWVMQDWLRVREAHSMLSAYEPELPQDVRIRAREELAAVSRFSVFAAHAESLRLQAWRPEDGDAAGMAARCDAQWAYKPGWYMMMRCGEAYALSGNAAALDRLAVAFCDGFPYHRSREAAWAKGFDEEGLTSTRISGRACLK